MQKVHCFFEQLIIMYKILGQNMNDPENFVIWLDIISAAIANILIVYGSTQFWDFLKIS